MQKNIHAVADPETEVAICFFEQEWVQARPPPPIGSTIRRNGSFMLSPRTTWTAKWCILFFQKWAWVLIPCLALQMEPLRFDLSKAVAVGDRRYQKWVLLLIRSFCGFIFVQRIHNFAKGAWPWLGEIYLITLDSKLLGLNLESSVLPHPLLPYLISEQRRAFVWCYTSGSRIP